MKKRILSALISVTMVGSLFGAFAIPASAATVKTPQERNFEARQVEKLNRGLIATYREANEANGVVAGVYLSWRLFGTESLTNQAFDIYRKTSSSATGKFSKLATTGVHDPTNYIDTKGKATYQYKVLPAGATAEEVESETPAVPGTNHVAQDGHTDLANSFTYMDIPIVRPDPVKRMGDGKLSYYYTISKDVEGGANDASVGDLDGDGDYEIVLKWDPTDSKDSASSGYTGNVYIDAYEIDPNNGGYKWRIDLGPNVTAGAHYTQFIVYDFDGDGKAEMACKTAPGSIDGTGHYVSEVGDTDAIRDVDNTAQFIGTSGRLQGKNPFTQYLTVFDGETGKALATTEYIPYEMHGSAYWGDPSAKYNRSERYLAGVAYLDGVHPSIIMCRGYYHHAVIRAYDWDGKTLSKRWEHDGAAKKLTSMFGQGNHQLSISDIDDDGKDEIVYGSASLDDDGVNAIGNTNLGHGDAMHVNDFNNDGVMEVFSVKEDDEGFKHYAEDLRVASTGAHFWADGKITTTDDNGRGVMANIDDAYAKTHSNALAIGWSSGKNEAHDLNGDNLKAKPANAGSGTFDNSLVYWDGDLGRELLDTNIIQKYDAENGYTTRFWGESDGYTLSGGTTNNYSKRNACLSADLWGDWREEIIMASGKGQNDTPALRIFTSTIWTDYRLTTLMHDTQYRTAIAWQNVGYNQPPHTSYYVGSAALANDGTNELNYLAPEFKYTKVKEAIPEYTKKQLYTSNGFSNGTSKEGFTGGTVKNGYLSGNSYNNLKLDYKLTEADDEYVVINSFKLNNTAGTAEADITNFSGETFNAQLLLASYDDGVLKSIVPRDVVVSPKSNVVVQANNGQGTSFKAMLWDSLNGIKPLTAVLTQSNPSLSNVSIKNGASAIAQVEFDWMPGDAVQLAAADESNIIKLTKEADSPIMMSVGDSDPVLIDNSLKTDGIWYHVKAVINGISQKADITIKDKTNNGELIEKSPILITGDMKQFNRISIVNSGIDNVTVTKLEPNEERVPVQFKVIDGNKQPVPDTIITVGNQQLITNESGTAIAKIKKGTNNYVAKKAGYQKTTGSINTDDVVKEITLGESEPSAIVINYKYGSTELKTARNTGDTGLPGTTYNVALTDADKADITYEGTKYEFNPDGTKTQVAVAEEGITYVTAAFKPKLAPAEGGTELAHLYLTENGTGRDAESADAYWTGGTDFGTSAGVRYITATETNPVTVNFANTSSKIVMEFDVMMKDMDTGGDVFGAIPYSGNTKGTGAGWRRDSSGTKWAPALTKNNTYLSTTGTYNTAATYKDKWTHVVMVCSDGQISVTYANLNDGTVYVSDQTIDSGLETNPINKVVFGRGYGSGNGTMNLRNFKAYTLSVSGGGEATTESKTLDIPSSTSFKPSATYQSDMSGISFNGSSLMGNITYELQNTDGTLAGEVTGLTLDTDNGVIKLTDEMSESATYKLVVKLDGSVMKTYNLTFRAKQIIERIETFDDGLNGFTITSGKSGYNLVHEDGMAKYTKTAGTANDSSVYLTYPITTTNLGDKYEISFDFKIVSAAFKGYLYLTNTAGDELTRVETHLYTPRMKIPSGTATLDFKGANVFDFEQWYTFVYSYENGSATINVYDVDDTEHTNPLVEGVEPITVSKAANGVTFKMQVAQNIQNGSAENADEYYFDNFRYSYYAY